MWIMRWKNSTCILVILVIILNQKLTHEIFTKKHFFDSPSPTKQPATFRLCRKDRSLDLCLVKVGYSKYMLHVSCTLVDVNGILPDILSFILASHPLGTLTSSISSLRGSPIIVQGYHVAKNRSLASLC